MPFLSTLLARLRGIPPTRVLVGRGLVLGRNVHIGPWSIIDHSHCHLIEIGDDVILGPRVHLLAHDASTRPALGYTRIGLVRIGDRAFIGAGSIVMPGVTVGEDAIVGAGSVVTADVPAGMLAVGAPAKVAGPAADYLARRREEMSERPVFEREWTMREGITPEMRDRMREQLRDGAGYLA